MLGRVRDEARTVGRASEWYFEAGRVFIFGLRGWGPRAFSATEG